MIDHYVIGGLLPEEALEVGWTMALKGLYRESMSELRDTEMFTSRSINISDLLSLLHKTVKSTS